MTNSFPFSDTKFLNGLRILLALWVAVGHFYQHIGGPDFLKFPFWYILMYPGPAVNGFIVITGFLMTYHYIINQERDSPSSSKTWTKFYIKRFFRLYPVYFIIILIAYFSFNFTNQQSINVHDIFFERDMQSFTYGANKNVGLIDLISHLTFVHGLIPYINASILGPAWSLSTEVQFYILFPFIFLFCNTSKKLISLIFISVVLYILTLKLVGIWETPGFLGVFGAPSLLSHKMIYFCLGIVMAKYKLGQCRSYLVHLNLLAICFFTVTYISTIVCIVIYLFMFLDKHKQVYPSKLLNVPIKIKSSLSSGIMSFGANISYSFYMIHSMIIPLSFHLCQPFYKNKDQLTYTSFAVFLILTFLLSWITYIAIEKPFMNYGKRLLSAKNKKSDN